MLLIVGLYCSAHLVGHRYLTRSMCVPSQPRHFFLPSFSVCCDQADVDEWAQHHVRLAVRLLAPSEMAEMVDWWSTGAAQCWPPPAWLLRTRIWAAIISRTSSRRSAASQCLLECSARTERAARMAGASCDGLPFCSSQHDVRSLSPRVAFQDAAALRAADARSHHRAGLLW